MAFDGSGRYSHTDGHRTGLTVWQQAFAAGVNPNAPDFDRYGLEIARALELTRLRDGQNSPTRDLPMANKKHLNCAEATEDNQYATLGQVNAASGGGFIASANVGGTANAISLTVSPSPPTYDVGKGYTFIAEHTNTGAVTLAEGSKAATAMRRSDGAAFEGGEIEAGTLIRAVYDGTQFRTNIGLREWFGTEAAYTALATKYDGVLYNTREA